MISSRSVQKKNTSSNLVQQALQQAKIIDPSAQINLNAQVRIEIENFPKTHTKDMIQKVCEVFGTVKHLELIKDPVKGKFRGKV
jgi:predicted GNAT family N-acyltransferase